MLSNEPHDEFLELCALSTSGQLSEEERHRLQQHVTVCSACREALHEYEAIVDEAIPAIGANESEPIDPGPGWSQAKAEKAFFKRLKEEEEGAGSVPSNGIGASFRRNLPVAPESTWRHVWMLYAAGILLFITLSLSAYWVGIRRGTNLAKSVSPAVNVQSRGPTPELASIEEQLSDAAHEREVARREIAERDKALATLRHQLDAQSVSMEQMKAVQARLASDNSQHTQATDTGQQREDLSAKLAAAQAESDELRKKLDLLTNESGQQTARAKLLEAKVNDLTRLLEDRENTINQQEELLAHDRDVRELMGARDLYIAEVHDVDDRGATKKPYGRVFYTKGKSLIFYAYDLDQQGAKIAPVFQAWGRRGPDWKQALNLGIFYEDNASKKRWILKTDDPNTLAKIDAVFVTAEPRGGSQKPSGKPLLFAYLRTNPNHP